MHIKPLLRNAAKLGLVALGGVLGAVAVVWIRANSDWVTVRLPGAMAPGSTGDIEYEARVYGIVAISFGAGVLAALWIAMAVWLRALRRERRLVRGLERVERQVEETRKLHGGEGSGQAALPSPAVAPSHGEGPFDEFDDFDEEEEELVSESAGLPDSYDADEGPEAKGEGEDRG